MMLLLFFLLCLVGFVISAYFTAIYLQISFPLLQSLAKICRIETGECERVIETPQAQLFKVPNFTLGMAYYLGLLIAFVFSFPFQGLLIFLAWGVAGLSGYLAHQLFYVLKMPCRLCYISHIINICIAILISFI